jgi:hypothetical protein
MHISLQKAMAGGLRSLITFIWECLYPEVYNSFESTELVELCDLSRGMGVNIVCVIKISHFSLKRSCTVNYPSK